MQKKILGKCALRNRSAFKQGHCIHTFLIIYICGCPVRAVSLSRLQASFMCRANTWTNYIHNILHKFSCMLKKVRQIKLQIHVLLNQLHHASISASQTPMPFFPASKGVVRLEIFHKLWSVPPFVIIFALTSSCSTLLCCGFIFLALSLEGRVGEDVP